MADGCEIPDLAFGGSGLPFLIARPGEFVDPNGAISGIAIAPIGVMAFSASALEDRTKRFAIAASVAARDECKRPDQWNAFSQLVRAAGSVGANHRAMSRSRSAKEFAAKLQIVCEEADEACYWLEVLSATSGPDALQPLLAEAKELRAIFAKARSTTRAKLATSPTRQFVNSLIR